MKPSDLFTDFKARPFPWNFWYFFKDLPNNIKWFFQRGWRGYADCDVWNFDCYFLSIAIPALKMFKSEMSGHPHVLTYEEWKNIIQEIIDGFEAGEKARDEIIADENDLKKLNKKFKKATNLFAKWFWHFWD